MAGRRQRSSVSQEDYLKAILEMEQEDQVPNGARLSDELGVTPPAVTAALKRMARHGTPRHQLAEKLLVEVLGMSWTRVHDEAEKPEHAISPELEELLLKHFGADTTCPHGAPLSR